MLSTEEANAEDIIELWIEGEGIDDVFFGQDAYLQSWNSSWEDVFVLLLAVRPQDDPMSFHIDEEGYVVQDVAFLGTTRARLKVPDTAPGTYRVKLSVGELEREDVPIFARLRIR